jgi:hypothetical protein
MMFFYKLSLKLFDISKCKIFLSQLFAQRRKKQLNSLFDYKLQLKIKLCQRSFLLSANRYETDRKTQRAIASRYKSRHGEQ